jgi:hypothetical protein
MLPSLPTNSVNYISRPMHFFMRLFEQCCAYRLNGLATSVQLAYASIEGPTPQDLVDKYGPYVIPVLW